MNLRVVRLVKSEQGIENIALLTTDHLGDGGRWEKKRVQRVNDPTYIRQSGVMRI